MAMQDELSQERRRALSTGRALTDVKPGTARPALELPPVATDEASAIVLANAWRQWMIDIGQGVAAPEA